MTIILDPEKFSQLPAAGPLTGPEIIPIVQDGVNKQTTVDDLPTGGVVESVVAGDNVTVDNTDPANPIVSAEASAAGVESVNSQTGNVVLDQDDIGDGTAYKQYSQSDKSKLAGIEAGAEVNNISDANATDLTDGGTTNLHSHVVTKSDVGLGNADNTSDLDKPISTATQSALDLKQSLSQKDIANGYPGLDGSGKINPLQLPATAITETFVVNSQSAMLALTAQVGDVAVRTDVNKSFILTADPASTLGNWQELLSPTDQVTSVFARQGVVTAQNGDYNAGQVTNTPSGGVAASTVQAAINELDTDKVDKTTTVNGQALSGNVALTKSDVGLSSVTNDAQAKIASNLSDIANPATAFSNIKQNATDTATGVVELAIQAEVDAGTDTSRVVTPDTLAGSYAGTKQLSAYAIEATTLLTTGDGKVMLRVPTALNGMDLISVGAAVVTTSSSGTPTIQIARGRQSSPASAHNFVDMLSTLITIDATEYDSKDATIPPVINTANDDVLTGDLIRIDVDVTGTGTKGLIVTMAFRLP